MNDKEILHHLADYMNLLKKEYELEPSDYILIKYTDQDIEDECECSEELNGIAYYHVVEDEDTLLIYWEVL